jgi:hypothetical protein
MEVTRKFQGGKIVKNECFVIRQITKSRIYKRNCFII